MIAMNGEEPSPLARWRGYFCPDLPMASRAGLEALTGPRSLDAPRRALADAGYKRRARGAAGSGAMLPYAKILADVTADLYNGWVSIWITR